MFGNIEVQYKYLQDKSMIGTIYTLEIEKDVNFVSRTSRDILLGSNFSSDIQKIENSIKSIKANFIALEKITDDFESKKLITDAHNSTSMFLDNTLIMMKSLTQDEIKNSTSNIYKNYKNKTFTLCSRIKSYI